MSSFARLLQVFGDARCVPKGRAVHAKIITSGFRPDISINNYLLSMYVKFNRSNDACKVFDSMPERDVVSWSSLISGYSQMGIPEKALYCFKYMVHDGSEPNCITYVGVLSACASLGDARAGKSIHGRIYRSGVEFSVPLSNSLVNMYGKSGLLKAARLVFDAIEGPNSISWTSLLSCYCQHGENLEGLKIFLLSRRTGGRVNEFSCSSALAACAALENLKVGMQMHSLVLKCGLQFDKFVESGLINLYSKRGELDLAGRAFLEAGWANPASWTALIGGYVQQGRGIEAINLFLIMHSSGFNLSEKTLSSVLGAFANAEVIEGGKQLHSLIIKMGFSTFTFVGNAIIDLYSKCGLLEESLRTFQEMDGQDVVSWNSLITGHAGSGHHGEAIELLRDMLFKGYKPNLHTYSIILSVCADIPAIKWGKETHCCIIKPAFHSNVVVGTALIDMYAKCGMLNEAWKVFDNLTSKNLISWNTMIVGYAQHGYAREALEVYHMMLRNHVKPNDSTFIGVLSACAHVGLVEEGLQYYNSMITDHGTVPRMEHLASMVNLFARKGQTNRAYEFIRSFSIEPSKVVWRCLLSGCKIHKDLVLGRYAAEKILSIDPEDSSALIMLSNVYAEAKMWTETAQVRKILKSKTMKKDIGYSWIELNNKMYFISAHHSMQFEGIDLCEILNHLTLQLFDAGYMSDAMFLFHTEE
ncbi:hypothetical protein SLE2022_111000 [Rubroshorea leprosula]